MMSAVFHAGDRGSNPLGTAPNNSTHYEHPAEFIPLILGANVAVPMKRLDPQTLLEAKGKDNA
jgi:hypothetical protein